MDNADDPSPEKGLAVISIKTGGLDTVDTCLRRLLSLRTRIETNWPAGGRFLGRGHDLDPGAHSIIADLLTSLPTPLPLSAGGEPEQLIGPTDADLRLIAGRAVDAGMALLDGTTMETPYPHEVMMLGARTHDEAGPITVSDATVGLLVATIIGTLEAISEIILEPLKPAPKTSTKAKPAPQDQWHKTTRKGGKRPPEPKRGPSVPRI